MFNCVDSVSGAADGHGILSFARVSRLFVSAKK